MIHDLFALYWNSNKKKKHFIKLIQATPGWCLGELCALGIAPRDVCTAQMCVYRCVYRTSAVSMPVHNWWCAGNLHICKLPVYSQTSSHKHSKSTNRPDTALAEKRQDKQHPTSKLGSLFFLSALPLPLTCLLMSASFFPLCSLFFFVPFIFHLNHFILSLLCPSHHPSCSLPFAPPLYPSPIHHSQQFLFTCHSLLFFLPECSYPIFITNLWEHPI